MWVYSYRFVLFPLVACPVGLYGQDCLENCDCRYSSTCHHITGECRCTPGFHGTKCEIGEGLMRADYFGKFIISRDLILFFSPSLGSLRIIVACEFGTWGHLCMDTCNCGANITCHPHTGLCECPPGYVGSHCEHGK